MKSLTLKAYAKINVGLRITGQRDDGYHSIMTLYQTVNIYDEVKLNLKDEQGVTFNWHGEKVPDGDDNICSKAANSFFKFIGEEKSVNIELEKTLPVGSGLGGGSSDAACVIRGLNELLDAKLSIKNMEEIASELGADIPFFIRGGCQYAEGIGDELSPGELSEEWVLLLVVPDIHIDTSWAYEGIHPLSLTRNINDVNLASFPHNGDAKNRKMFRNDFEPLVFSKYPEIGDIKKGLLRSEAEFASLSGSGSAVYGLYETTEKAEEAMKLVSREHKSWVLTLVREGAL